MVTHQTRLKLADNSGAKELFIIDIPGRGNMRVAYCGDVVTCVVKGSAPAGVVKDGEIVRAVVVRAKKERRRMDGSYVRFDENAGVVIDSAGVPKGTRVFGPVAREVREKGFLKIVSLAPEVI